MKRIDPDKMSRAELDRLGDEAEAVTFDNTRPLPLGGRRALERAAAKGGWPRVGGRRGSTLREAEAEFVARMMAEDAPDLRMDPAPHRIGNADALDAAGQFDAPASDGSAGEP